MQSLNLHPEISYTAPFDSPSEGEKRHAVEVLEKVKRHLRLSKLAPLSLEISTDGRTDRDMPILRSILGMLTGSGTHHRSAESLYLPNRLRELSIRYDDRFPFGIALKDSVVFPKLQTLDLCDYSGDWEDPDEEFPHRTAPYPLSQLPLRSPHLQTLKWFYADASFLPQLLDNPPPALTHIELHSEVSMSDPYDIFAAFPQLQHCSLHGVRDYDFDSLANIQQSHQKILLTHMEHLTIIGSYHPLLFLPQLTTPIIKTLSLVSLNNQPIGDLDSALLPFLVRSRFSGRDVDDIQSQNCAYEPTTYRTTLKLVNSEPSIDRCIKLLSMPSQPLEISNQYESKPTSDHLNGLLGALDWSHLEVDDSESIFCPNSEAVAFPKLRSLTLRGNIQAPDGFHLVKMHLQDEEAPSTKIYVEFVNGAQRVDEAILGRLRATATRMGKSVHVMVALCPSQDPL